MLKVMGWRRFVVVALIAIVSLTLVVGCSSDGGKQPAPAENGQEQNDQSSKNKGIIKIGMVNWAECVANSNLWKVILEDLGYQVKLTQLDAAPLYLGLEKGDLDIFLDAWLPITHETYWENIKTS